MNQSKGKILFVDDDQDTCEMMELLLHTSGYEVVTANSVIEGFHLAKQEPCDLILLDWTLEDGTGVELCRQIRTFDPKIPILFCSGRTDNSDAEAALSAGAQGYLIKPIELEDLLQNLSSHISQNNRHSR